jgi:hypothetical protein
MATTGVEVKRTRETGVGVWWWTTLAWAAVMKRMMVNGYHGGGSEEDNRNWCWGLVVDDAGVGGGDGAHIDEDGAHKDGG